MSYVYIARQPIFDKQMGLFGYELLYRKSKNNFYEGIDDDQSTAALLDNLFFIGFSKLIDGTRGFINFSQNMLLSETPLLLPKDRVIIEILERVEFNDSVIKACRKLKQMGYMLALDDFSLTKENISNSALLELVDIVKVVNFRNMTAEQTRFIRKHSNKIKFLAERIETQEEFKEAIRKGYTLFQGFFFSKPVMFGAKDIGTLNRNLLLILNELNKPEPSNRLIANIIEKDLGLTYKLLRMVNMAYYSVRYKIKSIKQALVHLGSQELYRWIYVMLIKGIQNQDNAELVKTSIIRGKMLALLAVKSGMKNMESDFFITGIFSSIDVLLNQNMESIINELPLRTNVADALLGKNSQITKCLNAILDFERAKWDSMDKLTADLGLEPNTIMAIYLEAIKWQQSNAD